MPFSCVRCGKLFSDAKKDEVVTRQGCCDTCYNACLTIMGNEMRVMRPALAETNMYDDEFLERMDKFAKRWEDIEEFEIRPVWPEDKP